MFSVLSYKKTEIMTVRTGKNTVRLPPKTIRSKQKRKSAVIGEIPVKKKGRGLGFLWVENCGKDAEAKGSNQDGNDLSKGSAWGIDNGFDDHAACGKRRTPKQADGTGCQFLLIVALVDPGAQCPLAKRAALCAGSPAFLKRAWARGMS